MTARMTRSAPQSPFELPEVRAVVRATRLSCQNAGEAQKFAPVPRSYGEIPAYASRRRHRPPRAYIESTIKGRMRRALLFRDVCNLRR